MKLSVVIPVYNEKDTITEIINKVKMVDIGENLKEVIVIDDASTDGTTKILKDLQNQNSQEKYIYKPKNSGKGDSLKLGFAASTGDYIIVQDADLEYDPNDYRKLIRELSENHVDVVYGSRFSGNYKDMSNLHYFGNKLLTIFTNIFFGVMLTDMETCYKLIPGNFARSVKLKAKRFDFEPEITAKILKSGLRIKEVPINYKGRLHSEGKKITWVDGIWAIWGLLKFRFFD